MVYKHHFFIYKPTFDDEKFQHGYQNGTNYMCTTESGNKTFFNNNSKLYYFAHISHVGMVYVLFIYFLIKS